MKNVLSKVKRWESMPERRESVTVKIVSRVLNKCDGKCPDILDLVLCDWSMLGIFCSVCLCKWTQSASSKKQPLTSMGSLLLVLIFLDLIFLCADRYAISQSYPSELHDTVVELACF